MAKKSAAAAPVDEGRAAEIAFGIYEPGQDDPLAPEHRKLNDLVREMAKRPADPTAWPKNHAIAIWNIVEQFKTFKSILAGDAEKKARFFEAAFNRYVRLAVLRPTGRKTDWPLEVAICVNGSIIRAMGQKRQYPTGASLLRLAERLRAEPFDVEKDDVPLALLASAYNVSATKGELGLEQRADAERFFAAMNWTLTDDDLARIRRFNVPPRGWSMDPKTELVGALEFGPQERIVRGEAWSDAALDDLMALPHGPELSAWLKLLWLGTELESGKPGAAWLKSASEAVDQLGFENFRRRLIRWFPLVDRPRTIDQGPRKSWEPDMTHAISREHVALLKGLVWACAGRQDPELTRALGKLAVSAYRKLPGIGPRHVALGTACVAVLGSLPGLEAIGQLAMLKTRIKFGTALKEIEKSFDASAQREDLPRDEIEELAVPAYGMEDVGLRLEEFGDYRAEMKAGAEGVAIAWTKEDGTPLKSVPASVKKEYADQWKELQGAAKDAEKMLVTVRDRIDGLLLSRKTWPLATWRARYLDHPLVGVVARKLIWTISDGGRAVDVTFADGRLVDRDGIEVASPGAAATVALWHPIGRPLDEVLGWRDRLEKLAVVQPFKQAHREVYLLTDAERRTRTYSNRFAAHVIKQHQFHALCALRGWKNRLRLMVDDSYPPASRVLPEWNLRAEFWVEGIGDDYGQDTTDSGSYLYLATDQVRFYPIDAAQPMAHASGGGYSLWGQATDQTLPLEAIPPLVLSEVMRDVDLFVGVASVGNDPNWSDGGPGGRHLDYWNRYSFGDLSATAQTRKAVLERLIPRLKIADRCRFSDKFLVVRGDLRTYKIHLGSGNILMEPNDQYLCIVPKQAASPSPDGKLFLPFEGDNVLSIILSKALMLADDRKIKDETITRQIGADG